MASEVQQGEGARKACVACGEMIPVSATVCSHCQQRQTPEKTSSMKVILGWVGAASAVLGLIGVLSGDFGKIVGHHQQKSELVAQMALAQAQTKQGEYEPAVRSYQNILKADPLNRQAQEGQLDTAMLWVENFQVLGREGQNTADLAAPKLDEIMPVLDAGLAREKGSRAADVQAHLGWAHWLNWHIAQREYGPSAEQNLRDALKVDPSNVYANAMLGNWMLQNNGGFQEAIEHLRTAAATGKERPLVRTMQLGGLIYKEARGTRAEVMRVANDMRKNGEPLDGDEKGRILGFCFTPVVTSQKELVESLSAVPEDDAWKTYLWLDDRPNDDESDDKTLAHDFIHANLLEVSGKRAEALEKYRSLQQELKNGSGTYRDRVDDAVKRLSH